MFVSQQSVRKGDAREEELRELGAAGLARALLWSWQQRRGAVRCHCTYREARDGGLIQKYIACISVQKAVQGLKTVLKVQIPNNVI